MAVGAGQVQPGAEVIEGMICGGSKVDRQVAVPEKHAAPWGTITLLGWLLQRSGLKPLVPDRH